MAYVRTYVRTRAGRGPRAAYPAPRCSPIRDALSSQLSVVFVAVFFLAFVFASCITYLGREDPWGSLTCGRLLEMAKTVQAKIKEGKLNGGRGGGGLQFEKLTHGFWRQYIRREVLRAGGERGGGTGQRGPKKTIIKLAILVGEKKSKSDI